MGEETYFGGDDLFSITDAAVAGHLVGCGGRGVHPQPGTALFEWWERVKLRPSVRKVLEESVGEYAGGTVAGAVERLQQGLYKRECKLLNNGGCCFVEWFESDASVSYNI